MQAGSEHVAHKLDSPSSPALELDDSPSPSPQELELEPMGMKDDAPEKRPGDGAALIFALVCLAFTVSWSLSKHLTDRTWPIHHLFLVAGTVK